MRGVDEIPIPLVLARCRRCRLPAGTFKAAKGGSGTWRHEGRRRCRCDPPPQLPMGTELDELVARAWRGMRYDGRAVVTVSVKPAPHSTS